MMIHVPEDDWKQLVTKVCEIHEDYFGGKTPENSMRARVSWLERSTKAVWAVVVAVATALLATVLAPFGK